MKVANTWRLFKLRNSIVLIESIVDEGPKNESIFHLSLIQNTKHLIIGALLVTEHRVSLLRS